MKQRNIRPLLHGPDITATTPECDWGALAREWLELGCEGVELGCEWAELGCERIPVALSRVLLCIGSSTKSY